MKDQDLTLIRAARQPGADAIVSLGQRRVFAARRSDAETVVNLSKRRTWHAGDEGTGAASGTQADDERDEDQASEDDNNGSTDVKSDAQKQSDADKAKEKKADDVDSLPSWAQKLIRDARQKEAAERIAKKKAEAEQSEKEKAQLAEQNQYQELSTRLDAEVKELRPKAERVDALEAFLRESIDARVKALPAEYRSLVPDYDDPLKTVKWLDENVAKFGRRQAPDLDAGKRGEQDKRSAEAEGDKLTDEELALAKRMNIDPKKMAAQKKRLAQSAR